MDRTRQQILQLVHARRPLPSPEERERIRTTARLRLQDIADLIGVTATTVWNWERGKCEPKAKHLDAYREVLETLAGHQEAA